MYYTPHLFTTFSSLGLLARTEEPSTLIGRRNSSFGWGVRTQSRGESGKEGRRGETVRVYGIGFRLRYVSKCKGVVYMVTSLFFCVSSNYLLLILVLVSKCWIRILSPRLDRRFSECGSPDSHTALLTSGTPYWESGRRGLSFGVNIGWYKGEVTIS